MTGRVHATAVAIGERGVLVMGPSGSGKSDLALRLIDRGAKLIADDQVMLDVHDGMLQASAPMTIYGRIEVRGLGIIEVEAVTAPVSLIIDLSAEPERMPEPRWMRLEEIEVPVIALSPFDASAPIKVELALKRLGLSLEGARS